MFYLSKCAKYSVFPSPPLIGEVIIPVLLNPIIVKAWTTVSIVCFLIISSLIMPLNLSATSFPHSNWGLIKHTISFIFVSSTKCKDFNYVNWLRYLYKKLFDMYSISEGDLKELVKKSIKYMEEAKWNSIWLI